MHAKKKICMFLALAMLGGTFAGCSESGAGNTDPSSPSPAPSSAETDVPETEEPEEATEADLRAAVDDGLTAQDMGGYAFRVLTNSRDDFINDTGEELEMTGDVVNDAIYARNLAVADRFNVKIEADFADTPVSVISHVVTAGDDSYDVCLGQIIQQTAICTNGGFYDWYSDLEYVDLSKPWYIGNAAEALSVKDHAYVMIGEYNLDVLRFTYCMYYNKNIADRYNLDEIYGVVKEGKWTYDYLKTLADMVYLDLDGNGEKDENDLLALSGDPYSAVVTYQYSFDNPIFRLNQEKIPEMIFDREKAHDIVVRLNALYWESAGAYTKGWGTGSSAWDAGNLLVYTGLFNNATYYRDLEFDFGIIPYPKYDESQTQYYTMADGAHTGLMVPITVSDPARTGMLLEALNAETWKKVVPAYFDTALKVKLSRDTESAEMLDLLMNSRVFDFGYMCGDFGLAFVVQNLVSTNSSETESAYTSKIKVAQKTFGKMIDAYLELDDGD